MNSLENFDLLKTVGTGITSTNFIDIVSHERYVYSIVSHKTLICNLRVKCSVVNYIRLLPIHEFLLIPGTFSRVYLCQHKRINKHFAVKILPINAVIQHKQVQHVRNEKEVLKVQSRIFISHLERICFRK